jgi:predicted SprT family Zn-dependent metalloprotease
MNKSENYENSHLISQNSFNNISNTSNINSDKNNILINKSDYPEIPTEYFDDYDYSYFEEEITKEDSDLLMPEVNYYSYTENESEYEEDFDVFDYYTIYNQIFFEEKLGCVTLEWSKRMTLCAGIFSVRNNLPVIRLSEPLLKFRTVREIKETLLHEMIHAWAYIEGFDQSDDRTGHGKHFKTKMYEINKQTGLNITVFHSFHDEVDYHRKHVWRCNGKCRELPPYFGWVKRAMNRAPGKSDKWWKSHLESCGGQFTKVETPNEYKKQKKTSNKTLDNFVKIKK